MRNLEEPMKYVYVVLIAVLLFANAAVFFKYSASTNSSLLNARIAIGTSVNNTTISTIYSTPLTVPFSDRVITIFYCSDGSQRSIGEIGFLKLLSTSSLSNYVGTIVFLMESTRYNTPVQEFIGNDRYLSYSYDNKSLNKTLMAIPLELIILSNNTVLYSGQLNKKFMVPHIINILKENGISHNLTLPAPGDSLYASIVSGDSTISLQDLTADSPILLYSSFCFSCNDNTLVSDIIRELHVSPIIILPNIHHIPTLMEYFNKLDITLNYYIIDYINTNIYPDTYLQSFPVVMIIDKGVMIYISNGMSTYESILQEMPRYMRSD